jgi:uncharacterized SAM-binding protein YcdF (DUF218 family)
VALLVTLAADWRGVLNGLGAWLITSNSPQHADLILVLGGDFYGPRVLKAADLAVAGYAPLVLISGVPYQDNQPEGYFAIQFLVARGYPRRLFESFGHHAPSTIDEAKVLRRELERRRVKRVLLVTSEFHSRRAAIVYRLYCPGIDFITIGAPDSHYHASKWWEDPSSREYFQSEWSKILGTVLIEYPKYEIENLLHKGDN